VIRSRKHLRFVGIRAVLTFGGSPALPRGTGPQLTTIETREGAGGWHTLPRGTGPHLSTIETRGVPDPFGV
jgi:hypothetical protein